MWNTWVSTVQAYVPFKFQKMVRNCITFSLFRKGELYRKLYNFCSVWPWYYCTGLPKSAEAMRIEANISVLELGVEGLLVHDFIPFTIRHSVQASLWKKVWNFIWVPKLTKLGKNWSPVPPLTGEQMTES